MKKSQLRQIIREEIQKAISEIKRVQVGPYTNAMGASSLKPGMNVSHIGVMDKLEHIGIIQWVEPKVTRSQFDNFTTYNVGYRKHEGGPVQTREFIQDDFFVENTTRTTDEETIKQYVDNDVAGSYVFFEGEPLFYTPDITDPELKNYREDGYEHFDIDGTGRTVNVRIF